MTIQVSSLDLYYLTREMQFLRDARVEKIYNPPGGEILFLLHTPSSGKIILRILSGKALFLTSRKGMSEQPGGFCMFLRKYLDGSRLREIEQCGGERIARLAFSTKEATYQMYAELFGQGNVILCDEAGTIINAEHQKNWKDRTIKKGLLYTYPAKDHNNFDLSEQEFSGLLAAGKEIVLTLAKDMGMGGIYAEELCERANIAKRKKDLLPEEKARIFQVWRDMLAENLYPALSGSDVIPFPFLTKKNISASFKTINEAFDHLYQSENPSVFVSKHQAEIDKALAIIKHQQRQVQELEKKAAENTRKGEIIYEKYQLIKEIIDGINKARTNLSFPQIKEKLKGHPIIKNIDPKEKKVALEIP